MEYIWFAGASGVGKTTLIETMMRPEGASLCRRFGVTGLQVQAFGTRSNDDIIAGVSLARADQVLIHWRYDVHRRIMNLWDERPDCGHRIILLWQPVKMMCKHLQQQGTHRIATETRVRREWKIVRDLFQAIDQERVPIELINASLPEYPRILDWPGAD